MKSLLRFIFHVVLALVAVAITFVVLFFTIPSWQEKVTKNVLSRNPSNQWQLAAVSIRPNRVHFEELYFLGQGIGVEVRKLSLAGPWWRTFISGHWEVNSGNIEDFYIDLSRLQISGAESAEWDRTLDGAEGNLAFWEDRMKAVLSRIATGDASVNWENVRMSGKFLLPGNRLVPLDVIVVRADSRNWENLRLALPENPPGIL